MQKIAQVNLQPYGKSHGITVPKIFTTDNKLEKGDVVEIWRDQIDGADVLILKPQKLKFNTEKLTEVVS